MSLPECSASDTLCGFPAGLRASGSYRILGACNPPFAHRDHTWAWIGPYGPPTRENGGFRMNLGFVVGDDAVAVIDSGYGEAMAEAMLNQIRRTTDRCAT